MAKTVDLVTRAVDWWGWGGQDPGLGAFVKGQGNLSWIALPSGTFSSVKRHPAHVKEEAGDLFTGTAPGLSLCVQWKDYCLS